MKAHPRTKHRKKRANKTVTIMINAEEVKRLKESYDPVGVALASTSAQYTHTEQ